MKLSEAVISYIQIRSSEGFDVSGKKFKKYTPGYAKSKGVGRGDVDLILSGDMLNELSLTNNGKGYIEIGYDDGSDQAGKAEGNQIGSYGQPDPDPNKARKFIGIDEAELEILIDSLDNEVSQDVDIDQIAKDIAREIFDDIEFGE